MNVLFSEPSDSLVWIYSFSKPLFRKNVSQTLDITFLQFEMFRTISWKTMMSKIGLLKYLISRFYTRVPVFVATVSEKLAGSSVKRIACEGGGCVTGHGSSIED